MAEQNPQLRDKGFSETRRQFIPPALHHLADGLEARALEGGDDLFLRIQRRHRQALQAFPFRARRRDMA